MLNKPPTTADDPAIKILNAGRTKCKQRRDTLKDDWTTSVDYRRGQPFASDSDSDRVYVNVDAPMTRRKTTQIASQAPEVRLLTDDPRVKPALDQFSKRLNKELQKAEVGDVLWETAVDVVNAAGFGWALCGFEARTEPKLVPAIDPMTFTPDQQQGWAAIESGELDPTHAQELAEQFGIPTESVPHVVSGRFYVDRGSPSDFLWDDDFEGSNFDKAPWLGHSGRKSWPEAKRDFNLKDEDKEAICGGAAARENLRSTNDVQPTPDDLLVVHYDEIFYWRARFDPNEKHLDCIWRMVWVQGKDDAPVINEPWKGQKYIKGVGYVGAKKLPIRVLTVDYFSDDPLPPSDSALARPQVNEQIRSRTQMILQRERSLPSRWHNTNLLDPLIAANLQRGIFQASIPVKGNGNNAIGETARASYPPENFEFDRTIKADLSELYGMGDNQLGLMSRGRRTAAESNNAQANFATQTGFQRARVAKFYTGIAEVMAGLLVLHGQDLPLPQAQDGQPPMDVAQMAAAFEYTVLPDSTMLLDANQQAESKLELLNMVGKSGFVNPKPLIEDIVRLKGTDPATVMMDPKPTEEKPSISYRFGGVQDLNDPIVLAMLVMEGKGPSPEAMKEAINIIQASRAAVAAGLIPPIPTAENDPQRKDAPTKADARPEWTTMPRIDKRTSE